MTQRRPDFSATRALFRGSFVFIAVVLATLSLLAVHWLHGINEKVRGVVQSSLESIHLVDRMNQDVERTRLLAQQHIEETSPAAMKEIERNVSAAEADFQQAALAFEPLLLTPAEQSQWSRVRDQAAILREGLASVLRDSSANADSQAQEKLNALAERFASWEKESAALDETNDEEALTSIHKINDLQQTGRALALGLGGLGVAFTLGVGVAVSSALGRRQDSIQSYASALELRNRELDAFAGRIAHGLRGPLTTINMAAAKLVRTDQASPETAALLQHGVGRIEALIRDLLTLSSVDAYARIERCEPAQIVRQLQEELQPRLSLEGGTLEVDVAPGTVVGSEALLHQALWNIMDNALRYRQPDVPARIFVNGAASESEYELRISDNGFGLTVEEQSRAFDPFFRGERAMEMPGTGIGLSVVRRVMENAGGRVSVHSTPLKGSTFVLRLPLAWPLSQRSVPSHDHVST